MKIRKRNLIIVALSLVALVVYLWWTEGRRGTIGAALRALQPHWLAAAISLILLYWLLEAASLHGVIRKLSPGFAFRDTLYVTMVGQLFNNITPFASGGQPMQAVSLVRSGLSLGVATSALISRFILYQTTLTLYSTLVLILRYRQLVESIPNFGPFILLGYVISLAVMAGLIAICFFRRFTHWVVHASIRLLAKLHLVKHPDEMKQKADEELLAFHDGFQLVRQNVGMMLEVIGLCFLQLTAFFLIPYMICLAFDLHGVSPVDALSAQAVVQMISSFVPLPGAMGGAEIGFYNLFSTFIPDGFLNMSVLIWRLITFYFPIVVGLLVCLFSHKKQAREPSPDLV